VIGEKPTPAGDSKNNKFAFKFHAYKLFSKPVVPGIHTKGPISYNIPTMDEHPKINLQ
jgi:hypothetical protein